MSLAQRDLCANISFTFNSSNAKALHLEHSPMFCGSRENFWVISEHFVIEIFFLKGLIKSRENFNQISVSSSTIR